MESRIIYLLYCCCSIYTASIYEAYWDAAAAAARIQKDARGAHTVPGSAYVCVYVCISND